MGLDDRRQATGRDSGECPKTVRYVDNLLLILMNCTYQMTYKFIYLFVLIKNNSIELRKL